MDFDTRYKKLNAAQKTAVDTIDGPLMVIAGPGTGKTELLSMRAANILRRTDTLPENILCLTFTESGAAAMRQRLSEIIGPSAFKVAIHTFHSFGSEVINQNGEYFYQGASFRAADELSSYELLRGIFDELDYNNPLAGKMNGEYTYIADMLTTIGELKKSGLTSDELLAVLDANEAVLDQAEPQLAAIFGARMSASKLSLLLPLTETIATIPQPELPAAIVPMANVLALGLAHAVDAAIADNSTKPVTAWKNRWMEKNDQGSLVFRDRKRHAKLRAASHIYYRYLSRMQEAELYDFDDMILRVVHAMEVFADLRFNLQEKHQYIMIDEFQDTNLAQMRIVQNLTNSPISEGRPNIMVVGDDDQAIYSFQGADVSNILGFEKLYTDVTLVTLTDNYRSSAPILASAREIALQGSERLETTIASIDKTLTPHRRGDAPVRLLEVDSLSDEREHIVQLIKQDIETGSPASSIALLARRHHELVGWLPYFSAAGLAINYERQDNVLETEPIIVMELLAGIVVAIFEKRHSDAEAMLPELLAHPAWGFEATEIWQLSLTADRQHNSWLEVMSQTPRFVPFQRWLITMSQHVPHLPLEQVLDQLLGKTDIQLRDSEHEDELTTDQLAEPTVDGEGVVYVSPLYQYFFSAAKLANNPDEYLVYLEALRTIRAKLRDYEPDETPTLRTMLAFIDLHRQLGSAITSIRPHLETDQGAVNLMTAHKAKGLEFDRVYLTGVIDSAWGAQVRSRSRLIGYPENLPLAPSGGQLDERLRLFFVAMTRAKTQLTISYSLTDDSGKATLGASFLLATSLTPESVSLAHDTLSRIAAAERRWYEPLITLNPRTMKELLAPVLARYKLSATHLGNFLDVTRGGPQAFLMNNLLRFPSAMSPAAAYGSAMHATLQRAHAHLSATGSHRAAEDILRDYEQNLLAQHLSDDDFTSFLQKGTDALTVFLEAKYASFKQTQRTELNLSGQNVVLGEARLTGSLDLVDIDSTARNISITDYKTGRPSSSWTVKTDYDKIRLHKYKQQLMFYQLLLHNARDYSKYDVTASTLQFVEPTQAGDIVALDAAFSPADLAQFQELIQAVWRRICQLDLPDSSQFDPSYKGIIDFEHYLVDNK